MRSRLVAASWLLSWASMGLAAPDYAQPSSIGDLRLFPDSERAEVFYYAPGELALAEQADGEPDLRLLLTRYRGTLATADQGAAEHRSVLSFGVSMRDLTPALSAAREQLRARSGRARILLRPLPIARVDTHLVFAPVAGRGLSEPAVKVSGGRLEADGESGRATVANYWQRRRFVLRLDDGSAQALWEAFANGRTLLSVSYAFFGRGSTPEGGSEDPVMEPEGPEEPQEPEEPYLVANGAFVVTVDAARWPQVLKKFDLNDQAPPGYPALEVFCYDFRNALRPDLELKAVEIEAEGVGGRPVRREVRFEALSADLFAQSVRFPFAVRLDRPYRYRTLEIARDGSSVSSAWTVVESWARLLDVTSPRSAKPVGGPSDAQN